MVQKQTKKGDLWIACFPGKELGEGALLQQLSFEGNKIHKKTAVEDSTTILTKEDKKIYLTDDLTSDLLENIVLGQKFKAYLKDFVTEINTKLTAIVTDLNALKTNYNTHTHIAPTLGGAVAPIVTPATPTTPQNLTTSNTDAKIDPTLSDFVFTRDKKTP